jgi:hypothetical protein
LLGSGERELSEIRKGENIVGYMIEEIGAVIANWATPDRLGQTPPDDGREI